jgi:superfamily II DNA or RNA helicase
VRPQEGFPEFPTDQQVIVDRDYQLEAVAKSVKEGMGVLDMPPRSGKTRVMCEIHRQISLPTLWTAPTDRIVTQTAGVLEDFFGKNYAMQMVGLKDLEKAKKTKVIVCTTATAGKLPQEFYDTREMIVIDEWHHGAAKTYNQDIFSKCEHIFHRYGMTGTFFRSGEDAMAMHALLAKTIYKVESQFLLDRGYLVPTKVVFLPMPRNPMLRGVAKSFVTGHGKYGIHEHQARNQLVAWAAVTLSRLGRKTLVLVGTKKQGYILKNHMMPFFDGKGAGQRFDPVEFVSTDKVRPVQGEILESYLNDQEVKILLGTSLLGEGVDLPNTDALVYARGEKAEVSLKQNAYRVCTAVPGKTNAVIVDFADRHHGKLLKHSHGRLNVYYNEATFDVEVLEDANRFADWAKVNAV